MLLDSGQNGDPEQHSTESMEPTQHDTDHEIQKNYEDLKRSLSEEFNKKMTNWGQKKLSKESSDGRPAGGGGGDDRHLSAEFRKKLDEWQRMKGSIDVDDPPPSAGPGETLPPTINFGRSWLPGNSEAGVLDLRRRMDPWHRREKSAGKTDVQVIFLRLYLVDVW